MTDHTKPSVASGARIGHVHLKVSDLERSVAFYNDILGFDVMDRYADQAAFLAADGYHHHIGLNVWESKDGLPPAPGTTGLFHLAILYPSREALARAVKQVIESGVELDGASDHGVSEAVYLRDPDHNGIELYCDREKSEWPRDEQGNLNMFTKRLDLNALLELAA